MRSARGVVLFVIALSLGAVAARHLHKEPIFVRVRGNNVHFRWSKPASLDQQNIARYAEPRETFIARSRELGASEVPGQAGEWYDLTNIASGERGWVAGSYVEPIAPADASRLKQLGPARAASDFSWLSFTDKILGIVLALLTIPVALVGLKELISNFRRKASNVIETPSNVRVFQPRSVGERTKVVFGASGGIPWVYRPSSKSGRRV